MTKKQDLGLNLKNGHAELVNVQIREHEIKTAEWELREQAQELYRWHDLFNKRFFDSKLNHAVLSFDRTRRDVLGHYVIERNGIGVADNININFVHLRREKWQTLETLLHEMAHQYQKSIGILKRGNNYHNKGFRNMMASFGFSCDNQGCHTGLPKDPFVSFLKEHGIEVTKVIYVKGQGRSKLKKFSCQCNPPINVRVASKRFSARCNHCGEDFKQVF